MKWNGMNERATKPCDECGSDYFADSSKMASLCPECAHWLYGYENCAHIFAEGRCTRCGWDGSPSNFVQSLKQD
jgi:predicted RNA-binding Zn-ribbon protein involved in translation (DUF1610 family)